MLVGNRIPMDFFITSGRGESDVTVHAGSYHLALRDAGIEMANIMTYSSILPGEARQVAKPHRDKLVHGSVMETIMAVASAEKGQTATAGIIFGWLHDRETGRRHGGLVCEYNGDLPKKHVPNHLRDMLRELYTNGYEQYDLREVSIYTKTVRPEKRFGTALVALCFLTYDYPFIRARSDA